jgi:hypothetical protein
MISLQRSLSYQRPNHTAHCKNIVLTIFPWVRYNKIRHRSRVKDRERFYYIHRSLERTQHTLQDSKGSIRVNHETQRESGTLEHEITFIVVSIGRNR